MDTGPAVGAFARLPWWARAAVISVIVVVAAGGYWGIVVSSRDNIGRAKIGDCVAPGGSSAVHLVSCTDDEASYRVTAVLGSGQSKQCPGVGVVTYVSYGTETICLENKR